MFRKPLIPVPRIALCALCLINAVSILIYYCVAGFQNPTPASSLPVVSFPNAFFFLQPRPDPFSLCPVPSVPGCCTSYARSHTRILPILTLANHDGNPSRRSARCQEKDGRSLAIVSPPPALAQPNRGAITLHCSPKSYSARGAFFDSFPLASASPPHPAQQPRVHDGRLTRWFRAIAANKYRRYRLVPQPHVKSTLAGAPSVLWSTHLPLRLHSLLNQTCLGPLKTRPSSWILLL